MRPGETNKMVIDYAPWSFNFGYPGVVPGMDYAVEVDKSGCSTGAIGGFGAPSNTNYELLVVANAPTTVDLSPNAAPAGNTFSYSVVPLFGPNHGTVVQSGTAGSPTFTYTPYGGFTGYDYFSYKMTDAQGRSVVRSVRLSVGVHTDTPDLARMATEPFIDPNSVSIDTAQQLVGFVVHMPVSADACTSYRLTIRQPARDCDRNVYNHFMCFDITAKDC